MFTRLSRITTAAFVLAAMLALVAPVLAVPPGNAAFQSVWDRTDGPVLEGLVPRTWMWGPEANSNLRWEPYQESGQPGRVTQYFDKARMEITNPQAVDDGLWYVTNGLLVVELITGRMQLGNDLFLQLDPALVNVAGDADDQHGPTYATFLSLLDASATPVGATVVNRVARNGNVQADGSLAGQGVVVATIDDVTGHAIAAPFWEFMQSSGLVRTQGALITQQLFINPFYATGRPIAEPYWANVKIADTYRDVLMQCFERRCLTYNPANPPGWQVEAGNVGQHYDTWRNHSGFEYDIEWIVAAQGGVVELNETTVTIPPGALAHDTLSTLAPVHGAPAQGLIKPASSTPALPDGYSAIAGSHLSWNPVANLSISAGVYYRFDDSLVPEDVSAEDLVVFRRNTGNQWTPHDTFQIDLRISFNFDAPSEWVVAYPTTPEGNDPPTAHDVEASAIPSVPQEITLSASDPDNDVYSDNLTFEIITGPMHGELDTWTPSSSCVPAQIGVHCTAQVTYTGEFDYTGPDSFTYRVSDGEDSSTLATVDLTLEYPASQTWTVDAEDGGTIDVPGRVVLIIPPGALNCDASITITSEAPAMGNMDPPASNQHEIEVEPADSTDPDCLYGVEITGLITLGLYYDPSAIPSGSTADDLYLGRQVNDAWEPYVTTWLDPDPSKWIVYTGTSLFSKWNVFVG